MFNLTTRSLAFEQNTPVQPQGVGSRPFQSAKTRYGSSYMASLKAVRAQTSFDTNESQVTLSAPKIANWSRTQVPSLIFSLYRLLSHFLVLSVSSTGLPTNPPIEELIQPKKIKKSQIAKKPENFTNLEKWDFQEIEPNKKSSEIQENHTEFNAQIH
uniref:Uncharacterized protein n=1 Tax=Opuntia streptacantha TaxID=393608 RepID=A0A7C9EUC3_OPUST